MKKLLFILTMIMLLVFSSLTVGAQEINILMEAVPDTTYVQELIPNFEEETGIEVDVEVVNYAEMHEKLVPQLISQEGAYDVIVVDNYWVGEFTTADWIINLEPYIEKSDKINTDVYIDSMFNMVGQVDGTTYMLPFYNYAMALVYRTDILEEMDEQIPTKLTDYVELCHSVTEQTEYYGAVMQGLRPDPIAMEWLNYLYSMGGDFYDDNGNIIINNDKAVEALELYVENINNNAPDGATGFGFDQAFSVIANGKAFSYITYNWMLPKLNDEEESEVAGKVDIAQMPGGHSLNGGWGWAIPKSSPDKESAWKFIEWVESFDVAKERALMGGSPTRNDVFNDEEVLEKYPHYTEVKKILRGAKPIPIMEDSTELIEVLGRELSLAANKDKTPQEALDTVAEHMKDLN